MDLFFGYGTITATAKNVIPTTAIFIRLLKLEVIGSLYFIFKDFIFLKFIFYLAYFYSLSNEEYLFPYFL